MGFSQPKVKLRLCEQLRIHAPQIFSKGSVPAPESQPKYTGNFVTPVQPPFPVAPPFRAPPPPEVSEPEGLYQAHKPDPQDPANDSSILTRTGNLARNGKKLAESLAIKISGQCSTFLGPALETINITHRLKWEEASKNVPLAVFSIHSANALKLEPFVEYIEYFKSKNRVGSA